MPAPDCPVPACPYGPMLGEHGAEIRNLKDDVHAICTRMDALIAGVQAIERLLAEQRGGRKALWMLLTASGAAGGLLTAILSKVHHLLKLS